MSEKKKELIMPPSRVEEVALAKIQQYMDLGLTLPNGFNPTNSLKKARMMLNDMKVNGKPVLEVCTPESVIQCLIDACCKGLDFSESQIYFIPRGNVLTTMESIYGRITRAKRASRFYKPIVQYVHEDDQFVMGVDPETGKTIIRKHETSLENLDKPIIAAYTYVTDDNNDTEVFVMTKKEWLTSWKKSSNNAAVAKEFERDMIYRTIIKKATKSLVNANISCLIYEPGTSIPDDDTPLAATPEQFIIAQPSEPVALPEPEVIVEPQEEVRPTTKAEVPKTAPLPEVGSAELEF